MLSSFTASSPIEPPRVSRRGRIVVTVLVIVALGVGGWLMRVPAWPSPSNDPAAFTETLDDRLNEALAGTSGYHDVRAAQVELVENGDRARVRLSNARTLWVVPDPMNHRPWVWIEVPLASGGWDAAVVWQRRIDHRLADDRTPPPSAGDAGTRAVTLADGTALLTRPDARTVVLRFPLELVGTVLDSFPDSVSAHPEAAARPL